MEWYFYPALVFAGFAAGFINTLAGSGSAVTLPVLILLGLPANVANGTNRVAMVLQAAAAGESFRRRGVLDVRGALTLSVPAVVGSVIGAQIAADLNEELMTRVIGMLMLVILAVVLLKPKRWLQGHLYQIKGWPDWRRLLLFLVIGVHGGFIQVGVGIFLLAGLVLGLKYDLVRANAVKVAINVSLTAAALLVFIRNGQVQWVPGLILAVGAVAGARAAAVVAVEKGAIWVRRALIAIVLFAAAKFLGVLDLLSQLAL
jgi:uncharacterized membrane protein YfcA